MQYNIDFKNIIAWYGNHKRDLPFRNTSDPYKIWLSEIMLQQTQIKTAIPYYKRWIKKMPTLEHVVKTNEEDLLKLWEGLGYYNRLHNFYKAVTLVFNKYGGVIPNNYDKFLSLPGVGKYTAAAVLSIAYQKPYPAIDVNIKRVLARYLGIKNFTIFNKKKISKILNLSIDKFNPGQFNQAIMELGALICSPRSPSCLRCPIKNNCKAYRSKNPEEYPTRLKKKEKPHYHVAAGLIWRGETFYIQKRKRSGMLPGLWEFPGTKKRKGEGLENALKRGIQKDCGISIKITNKIGRVQHAYSHFSITFHGFNCIEKRKKIVNSDKSNWICKTEFNKYTFPQANHKLLKLLN